MSKKLLQFIVIILAILIFFCFSALIYGFYLKLTKNQKNAEISINNHSLNLTNNEKIINIQPIDNQQILFTISKEETIYALIYNVNDKSKQIITNK